MSSEARASSNRSRHADLTVKPPCKIDARAIIAEKAQLVGTNTITIGANSVIHPAAKLDATYGPVTIGENCIVYERVTVGFSCRNDLANYGVTIGNGVTIDTRAVVEAQSVGEGSLIGACTVLGLGSEVGKYCKLTPSQTLKAGRRIPDFTVIFNDGQERRNTSLEGNLEDAKVNLAKGQAMQIELFRKLISSNIAKWSV